MEFSFENEDNEITGLLKPTLLSYKCHNKMLSFIRNGHILPALINMKFSYNTFYIQTKDTCHIKYTNLLCFQHVKIFSLSQELQQDGLYVLIIYFLDFFTYDHKQFKMLLQNWFENLSTFEFQNDNKRCNKKAENKFLVFINSDGQKLWTRKHCNVHSKTIVRFLSLKTLNYIYYQLSIKQRNTGITEWILKEFKKPVHFFQNNYWLGEQIFLYCDLQQLQIKLRALVSKTEVREEIGTSDFDIDLRYCPRFYSQDHLDAKVDIESNVCFKTKLDLDCYSSGNIKSHQLDSHPLLDKKPSFKISSNVSKTQNSKDSNHVDSPLPWSCHLFDNISSFGKLLKLRVFGLNHVPRHMLYQTLFVYPVFNQNERLTIHKWMRYEIFRVCSFAYSDLPIRFNVSAAQLAQAGFYNVTGSVLICCFSCGYQCELTDQPAVENALRHDCRGHEQNIPLNEWTTGLSQDDFQQYCMLFGGMTPPLFGGNMETPENTYSEPGALDNQLVISSQDETTTGFAETSDGDDTILPMSAPALDPNLEAVHLMRGASESYHSLPINLNEVSGSLVIQESEESHNSQFLTSVSSQPISVAQLPIPTAHMGETVAPSEPSREHIAVLNTPAPEENVAAATSVHLTGASYPQFASAGARRSTFSSWNPDHPQRPDDLVAGGFFYAGYADCTRCFYCGLGLKYWRPTDIPAYQHARFRPNCVFNKMYKGQEYVDRVQQDIREEQERLQRAQRNPDDEPIPNFPTQPPRATSEPPPSSADTSAPPASNEVDDDAMVQAGTPEPADVPNEGYLNLPVAQEALRSGWRSEQVLQAVTQVIDEMGIAVQNVHFDIVQDVLRELYSANDAMPNRGLAPSSRSEALISSSSVVDQSMASIRPQPPPPSLGETFQKHMSEYPDGSSASEPDGENRTREQTDVNHRTICSICHERVVNVLYLPCRHVIACQVCAANEATCRACNRNIIATTNIYL